MNPFLEGIIRSSQGIPSYSYKNESIKEMNQMTTHGNIDRITTTFTTTTTSNPNMVYVTRLDLMSESLPQREKDDRSPLTIEDLKGYQHPWIKQAGSDYQYLITEISPSGLGFDGRFKFWFDLKNEDYYISENREVWIGCWKVICGEPTETDQKDYEV